MVWFNVSITSPLTHLLTHTSFCESNFTPPPHPSLSAIYLHTSLPPLPPPSPSSDDEDILHIDIQRDPNGFGFSIRGGSEYNAPLCVLRMAPGGAAERDGRLRVRTQCHTSSCYDVAPPLRGRGLGAGGG